MNRVRHSVWLTLLISAAAAVLILPTPQRESRGVEVDPLRARISEVDGRFSLRSELFRREHSRVLAEEAVARTAHDTASVTFVRAPDVSVGFEQRLRPIMTKGLSMLPRRDPNMRIIVVLTVDTSATLAGAPVQSLLNRMSSLDVFPPGVIARDVCVEVASAHHPRILGPPNPREQNTYYSEPPGACWWYAAYGTPGRGVAAWLDSTQYAPIQRRDNGYFYDWWPWEWIGYVRDDLGVGSWIGTSQSRFAMAACAAGKDASCGTLVFSNIERYNNEGASVRTTGWVGQGRSWNIMPNTNAGALLRRLQSELGPDEFAQFWKSDLPMAESFQKLRGASLISWVRGQAQAVVPEERDRAAPSALTTLALLLLTAAFVFLGIRAVARRSGFA